MNNVGDNVSKTAETWLEDGFALAWPESIPRADYGRAIELILNVGGALRGLQRRSPMPSGDEEASASLPDPQRPLRKTYGTRRLDAGAMEEIKALLYQGEWSAVDLAQKLGLKWADSVGAALKRMGVRAVVGPHGAKKYTLMGRGGAPAGKRSRHSDTKERIAKLLHTPALYIDIARTLGVSTAYVSRIGRRLGAKSLGKNLWVLPNGKPKGVLEVPE